MMDICDGIICICGFFQSEARFPCVDEFVAPWPVPPLLPREEIGLLEAPETTYYWLLVELGMRPGALPGI